MNWKKLTIGITVVNLLGWFLIELWSYRYAGTNISDGSTWMIVLQLIGYYIVTIGSRVPEGESNEIYIHPKDCPGHDWQGSGYKEEKCTICQSIRRVDIN